MILVDCDVLSHFIKGGHILLLPQIYQEPMRVLEQVETEFRRYKSKEQEINLFFSAYAGILMPFPNHDLNIQTEYLQLRSRMGAGESACLAVAKYTKDIVASSNIKDIQDYCNKNQITYYTTMDFLCEALRTKKLSQQQCDDFISKVLKAGSRLPVTSMDMYPC